MGAHAAPAVLAVGTPAFCTDARIACRDADRELFYQEGPGWATYKAKEICARCLFRAPCREWGIEREMHGVWGMTTPAERQDIRAARRIGIGPRPCEACEAEYQPRRASQRTCSGRCSLRLTKRRQA